MKKALVTGANGFMGHHLVKELVDNNYIVYAIVRNKNSDISNIASLDNVQVIFCDLSEIKHLSNKIQDDVNDAIFYHLAWEGNSGLLRENYEVQLKNAMYTAKAAEAAAKMGCLRFVVSGSVTQLMYRDYLRQDGVEPEMITCYAIGKITAEALCKCICTKFGIDLCWLYIANFYGEEDKTQNIVNFVIECYLDNKEPILTPAEQLADFIYVTDVARGMRLLGEKGKKNSSYCISYGEPHPLKEYILQIYNIIQPKCGNGIGKKKFQGKNIDFDEINYKKFEIDAGFVPAIDFYEGISRVIEAHRKKRKLNK